MTDRRKLETIREPLFKLKWLLKNAPSLDCMSQINDEGEQRNFFVREIFEESLEAYCKAGLGCVEEIFKIIE